MADQCQPSAMVLWSPIWIVALMLAVGAPWFVRVLADRFELRVRRRTQALVTRAREAALHSAPDSEQGSEPGGGEG